MLLGLCGALGFGSAFASGDYYGEEVSCSHGYWKNHTEVWFGEACDNYTAIDTQGTTSCGEMLEDLQARGKGSEAVREYVRDYLDYWATVNNREINCND